MLTCIIVTLILIFSACLYQNCKAKRRSDNMNFTSIIKFFFQVGDLFTDIFFNAILYLENRLYLLTYISISLMLFSYIGSIIMCVYWNIRWREWTLHYPRRLHQYLDKYPAFLIILTIISNFYVSVDFARSKLFSLNRFYLPLTKNEHLMLDKYRFINIVLIENVAEIIIQIIYIQNSDSSQINSVVFISVVFSAMSILASTMNFVMNTAIRKRNKLNRHFGSQSTIDGNFTIKSDRFRHDHAFTHHKIGKCMITFLINQIDQQTDHYNTRSDDISLLCDVFHISNNISLRKEIKVYFMIEILHSDNMILVRGVYNILSQLLSNNNGINSNNGWFYDVLSHSSSQSHDCKESDHEDNIDHDKKEIQLTHNGKKVFLSMLGKTFHINSYRSDENTITFTGGHDLKSQLQTSHVKREKSIPQEKYIVSALKKKSVEILSNHKHHNSLEMTNIVH